MLGPGSQSAGDQALNTGSGSIGSSFATPVAAATATVAVAINVINMPAAVIQNNSIAGVALTNNGADSARGIMLTNTPVATISGNDVSNVGAPGASDVSYYGLSLICRESKAPANIAISGNRIRQSTQTTTDLSKFYGISVVVTEEDKTSVVAIDNNGVSASSSPPLVDAQTTVNCLLNGNHCVQLGSGKTPDAKDLVVAFVKGTAVIAGNNRIVCEEPYTGVAITAGANKKQTLNATLTGNIVGVRINLNGVALQPTDTPWGPLNIID